MDVSFVLLDATPKFLAAGRHRSIEKNTVSLNLWLYAKKVVDR